MSTAFKFSLQHVLNHRLDLEETFKLGYQQAQLRLRQDEEKVEEIRMKISTLNRKLSCTGLFNIVELQQLMMYKEQLNRTLLAQQNVCEESRQKVEMAKGELIKSKMDVQIIEKLKEKQLDEFKQLEKIEESKLLDELASINYCRH